MHLVIVRLCVAMYSSGDHVVEAEWVECFEFHEPVHYDVESCSGEVTTPLDDWSVATCELTRGE